MGRYLSIILAGIIGLVSAAGYARSDSEWDIFQRTYRSTTALQADKPAITPSFKIFVLVGAKNPGTPSPGFIELPITINENRGRGEELSDVQLSDKQLILLKDSTDYETPIEGGKLFGRTIPGLGIFTDNNILPETLGWELSVTTKDGEQSCSNLTEDNGQPAINCAGFKFEIYKKTGMANLTGNIGASGKVRITATSTAVNNKAAKPESKSFSITIPQLIFGDAAALGKALVGDLSGASKATYCMEYTQFTSSTPAGNPTTEICQGSKKELTNYVGQGYAIKMYETTPGAPKSLASGMILEKKIQKDSGCSAVLDSKVEEQLNNNYGIVPSYYGFENCSAKDRDFQEVWTVKKGNETIMTIQVKTVIPLLESFMGSIDGIGLEFNVDDAGNGTVLDAQFSDNELDNGGCWSEATAHSFIARIDQAYVVNPQGIVGVLMTKGTTPGIHAFPQNKPFDFMDIDFSNTFNIMPVGYKKDGSNYRVSDIKTICLVMKDSGWIDSTLHFKKMKIVLPHWTCTFDYALQQEVDGDHIAHAIKYISGEDGSRCKEDNWVFKN